MADPSSRAAEDGGPASTSNRPTAQQPNPGDEAVAGTVGTGEDTCPRCGGTGKLAANQACPDCGGTGTIIQGIGGG